MPRGRNNNLAHNDLIQAILKWFSLQPGAMAIQIDSGGIWDPVRKIYRKKRSKFHVPGVSDILFWWGKKYGAIECKTGVGRLTDDQRAFLERMIRTGGYAIEARQWTDVPKALGVPLLHRPEVPEPLAEPLPLPKPATRGSR